MNISEQTDRNSLARKGIERVSKNHGIRWGYIANKIDMTHSSFSHWKSGKYDFGKNKLAQIENLIESYDK
jgi:hypothetical protein